MYIQQNCVNMNTKRYSKENDYPFHNSPQLETIPLVTIVIFKQWTTTQQQHVSWAEAKHKEYMPHSLIYIKFKNRQNYFTLSAVWYWLHLGQRKGEQVVFWDPANGVSLTGYCEDVNSPPRLVCNLHAIPTKIPLMSFRKLFMLPLKFTCNKYAKKAKTIF